MFIDFRYKELFSFIMLEIHWCLGDGTEKDIYTKRIRESLSDELIQELLDEINKYYDLEIKYSSDIEDMDIFELTNFVIGKLL